MGGEAAAGPSGVTLESERRRDGPTSREYRNPAKPSTPSHRLGKCPLLNGREIGVGSSRVTLQSESLRDGSDDQGRLLGLIKQDKNRGACLRFKAVGMLSERGDFSGRFWKMMTAKKPRKKSTRDTKKITGIITMATKRRAGYRLSCSA